MEDPRIPVALSARPACTGPACTGPACTGPACTGPEFAGQAWLIDGDAPAPPGPVERFTLATPHAPGCACCLPRGAAAEALRRLFLRRARGEIAFFNRVTAIPSGPAAVAAIRDALRQDIFVAARYRAV